LLDLEADNVDAGVLQKNADSVRVAFFQPSEIDSLGEQLAASHVVEEVLAVRSGSRQRNGVDLTANWFLYIQELCSREIEKLREKREVDRLCH
jgi:hypothetical protein